MDPSARSRKKLLTCFSIHDHLTRLVCIEGWSMIAWWSGLKFDEGTLHPETERVFRIDGESITLFRHQLQAVAKAAARQSFVVTTGTGSGKSLCFSVPLIDSAI